MTTAYQTALDSLHWIDQVRRGGLDYDSPSTFEATGAGSTTTIVSTTLAAHDNSNDDRVGRVVICTRGDSRNVGLPRRVVSYVVGTGTLTIDALPAATAENDAFLLLTMPIPVIAADANEAAADEIQDASLTQANDFWNGTAEEAGPRIEVIAGSAIATTDRPLVDDFVSLNGVFTPADNFSGNAAIGDYAELWCDPQIMNDALLAFSQEPIERKPKAGEYGSPAHVQGLRVGAGTVELAFRGPGRTRIGEHAELHRPLKCVFTVADGGDTTIDAGSTTSALVYSVGGHSVGEGFVTEGGSAGLIIVDDGVDTYTPSPNVDTAPGAGETLYGCTTYTPRVGAAFDLGVKQYRGNGILEYFFGVVPKPQFNGSGDDFLRVALELGAADGFRLSKTHAGTSFDRPWTPKRSTVDEQKLGDMRCIIGGTSINLQGFSFNPNLDIQPRTNHAAPNRTDGFEIVNDDPRGQLDVLLGGDTLASLDDFLAGRELTLLIQVNRTPGYPGVFFIWAYRVQYTGAELGDKSGLISVSLPFKVNTHVDSATLPRYAIGIA